MNKFNIETLVSFYNPSLKGDYILSKANFMLFETDFLTSKVGNVFKKIERVKRSYGSISEPALLGKVRYAIKGVDALGDISLVNKELIKLSMAKTLLAMLVHEGQLTKVNKIKFFQRKGRSIPLTQVEYVFDNSALEGKNPLEGLEDRKGVYTQTHVGNTKVTSKIKKYCKRASSIPFKVSDIATRELIMFGYKLSKGYNSKSKYESRSSKKDRYGIYADLIMDKIYKKDKFYFPITLDSRGRETYEFQLEGLRPQGKLWEVLLLDRADSPILHKSAIKHLKHIIYTTNHGRCTLDYANDNITQEEIDNAREIDIYDMEVGVGKKYEKEFGERILLLKAGRAIKLIENGLPCPYLFPKDMTNSGLIMLGASTKSYKMQLLGNTIDKDRVYDSHTAIAEGLGIEGVDRDVSKKINTELLHGSSLEGLLNTVHSELEKQGKNLYDLDIDFLSKKLEKIYGKEVINIQNIADYGYGLVDMYNNRLKWITDDGMKCTHYAISKGVPLEVKGLDISNKTGISTASVVLDLPLAVDTDGYNIFSNSVEKYEGVQNKRRGLLANIIHSLDAQMLRAVANFLSSNDEPIIRKHDAYFVSPDMFDDVISVTSEYISELSKSDQLQRILAQIAKNAGVKHYPDVVTGDSVVEDSIQHLQP